MNPIYSIAALFIVLVVLAKAWSWARPANESGVPSDDRPSVNPRLGALVGFAEQVRPFNASDFDKMWNDQDEEWANGRYTPSAINYSLGDH